MEEKIKELILATHSQLKDYKEILEGLGPDVTDKAERIAKMNQLEVVEQIKLYDKFITLVETYLSIRLSDKDLPKEVLDLYKVDQEIKKYSGTKLTPEQIEELRKVIDGKE